MELGMIGLGPMGTNMVRRLQKGGDHCVVSDLAKFEGRVSNSGEGRWTLKATIDESVPAPVLSIALFERFSSRGEDYFTDKFPSALRYEFGGHKEKTTGGD